MNPSNQEYDFWIPEHTYGKLWASLLNLCQGSKVVKASQIKSIMRSDKMQSLMQAALDNVGPCSHIDENDPGHVDWLAVLDQEDFWRECDFMSSLMNRFWSSHARDVAQNARETVPNGWAAPLLDFFDGNPKYLVHLGAYVKSSARVGMAPNPKNVIGLAEHGFPLWKELRIFEFLMGDAHLREMCLWPNAPTRWNLAIMSASLPIEDTDDMLKSYRPICKLEMLKDIINGAPRPDSGLKPWTTECQLWFLIQAYNNGLSQTRLVALGEPEDSFMFARQARPFGPSEGVLWWTALDRIADAIACDFLDYYIHAQNYAYATRYRKCVECGDWFEHRTRHRKQYCSTQCKDRAKKSRLKERPSGSARRS